MTPNRVALLFAVLFALAGCGGSDAPPAGTGSPSAAASPRRVEGTLEIMMREQPNYLAVTGDGVWVTESKAGTVAHIEPEAGSVDRRVELGGEPGPIVFDGSRLWVGDADARLVAVDPDAGRVVATVSLPASPGGVAAGAGAVWVASAVTGAVYKIDPATAKIVGTFPVRFAEDVAADDGQVWVAGPGRNTVSRLDPVSGAILASVDVPGGVHALALHDGSLWIGAGPYGDAITRIETATAAVAATIDVEPRSFPDRFAFSDGAVWAGQYRADRIVRIDPARNTIVEHLATGDGPAVVVTGFGRLWVANFDGGTVWRIPI